MNMAIIIKLCITMKKHEIFMRNSWELIILILLHPTLISVEFTTHKVTMIKRLIIIRRLHQFIRVFWVLKILLLPIPITI